MNMSYLRHFFEVVKSGSFVRAARETKVSQPNLSRSVSLLERELGCLLMSRGKGGIQLTEQGKLLFSEAKPCLERLDVIQEKISDQKSNRTLRIAASENLCIHVLPKKIKTLLDRGCCRTVELLSGSAEQIEERVDQGQADFGLSYHLPKRQAMKRRVLKKIPFALALPKSKRSPSGLPYVGSRASEYSKPYLALRLLEQNRIRPSQIIESNSQEAQIRMVAEGVGYTVVPEFLVEKYSSEVSIYSGFQGAADIFCIYRGELSSDVFEIIK